MSEELTWAERVARAKAQPKGATYDHYYTLPDGKRTLVRIEHSEADLIAVIKEALAPHIPDYMEYDAKAAMVLHAYIAGALPRASERNSPFYGSYWYQLRSGHEPISTAKKVADWQASIGYFPSMRPHGHKTPEMTEFPQNRYAIAVQYPLDDIADAGMVRYGICFFNDMNPPYEAATAAAAAHQAERERAEAVAIAMEEAADAAREEERAAWEARLARERAAAEEDQKQAEADRLEREKTAARNREADAAARTSWEERSAAEEAERKATIAENEARRARLLAEAGIAEDEEDDSGSVVDPKAEVIAYLRGIRDNPPNRRVRGNPVHIRKWNRALASLGEATGEDPWSAAEIQVRAEKWPASPWARLVPFVGK